MAKKGFVQYRSTRLDFILNPFRVFFDTEASGGILLLICALIAMFWANSQWAESYHEFWEVPISVGYGNIALTLSLRMWINDLLMAIFFFVVGLEIKREFLVGELSEIKQAALPIAAAIGGMVVPALIYVGFNWGTEQISGWGIPMATDIAFAIGAITLLGKRVPLSLKVFLTALAIVDDIGAVLVIAFFYTSKLSLYALGLGAVFLFILGLMNWARIQNMVAYLAFGFLLWCCFLSSGVHATIAGVLFAFTIPARNLIDSKEFLLEMGKGIDEFKTATREKDNLLTSGGQISAISRINYAVDGVATPLSSFENFLHPWVSFFIMPLFALANAGVTIESDVAQTLASPISLGIICGLILGKQIGVTLGSWIAVKLGLARLPRTANWMQIYGVSWLAGIGFTMSLFVANLAFNSEQFLIESKLSILVASAFAGIAGYLILRASPTKN